MNDCSAILLAAGRSRRLGFDKILTPIAGKPVVQYSLEALAAAASVGDITLATRPDLIEPMQKIAQTIRKPVKVIEGGKERQDSVACGLQHALAKYVLIHDAARPLLTVEMVEKLLAEARKVGSAVCAQRATDTLKRAAADGLVQETLDRSQIWFIQTPQIFERDLIAQAYNHVQKNKISVTDDASAVENFGKAVKLVDPGGFNLKITRQTDWELVSLWLCGEKIASVRPLVHQLCNQSGPLIGYLPLLEKHGGGDAKFREYFEKIRKSCTRLQEHLRQLQQLVREISSDAGPNEG